MCGGGGRGGENCLDFGDRDLIFKATSAISIIKFRRLVRIASCLHSVVCTNGCILTKLAQIYNWDGGKKWLDFGDLDLIFNITPAL